MRAAIHVVSRRLTAKAAREPRMEPSTPLDRDAPFYIAGHPGLVGGAVWRHLKRKGFTNLVGRSSPELDLRLRTTSGRSSNVSGRGTS